MTPQTDTAKPRQHHLLARFLLLALLAAGMPLLASCAPRLQAIGPDIQAPFLTPESIITADGAALPMRTWLPRDDRLQVKPIKAVVLALHGFNDYSRGMTIPGAGLARRGIAVYAYDQRGFGGTAERGIWPGDNRLVADLRVAIDLLHKKYPGKPLFLLGESMGGSVVMAGAVENPTLPVDGIILASPAVWGWETQSSFNRDLLNLAVHTIPWMPVYASGIRVQPSDNTTALRALAYDPLVIKDTRVDSIYGLVNLMSRAYRALPSLCRADLGEPRCLILYGGREDIQADSAVRQMLASLPDLPPDQLRLALYRDGHHLLLRDLDAQTVFTDIATWIDNPAQPLPSGADKVSPKDFKRLGR
ncbi:MAG: alpha/beta fold hydrolase [Rhodospirillaceae bacterium]|nr:MAG: alpha/beta fold hydrolase [Rhodospirillaceae bacterium]